MTTLDDKLLGEKLQYYYSSSEDEDSDHEDKDGGRGAPGSSSMTAEAEPAGEGISVNTGPKGVINDWRRFKQLETEQREEQCREMERLIKKLSMTCRSHLDEEEERQREKDLQEKMSSKVTGSSEAPRPAWLRGLGFEIPEGQVFDLASGKLCGAESG